MASKKRAAKKSAEQKAEAIGFSLMEMLAGARPEERWLTIAEAAKLRGTSRHAVRDLIKRERLPAKEVAGRYFIKLSDLEAFDPKTWKRRMDEEAEGWFDPE
jgi:excisionase family DNA binding protein